MYTDGCKMEIDRYRDWFAQGKIFITYWSPMVTVNLNLAINVWYWKTKVLLPLWKEEMRKFYALLLYSKIITKATAVMHLFLDHKAVTLGVVTVLCLREISITVHTSYWPSVVPVICCLHVQNAAVGITELIVPLDIAVFVGNLPMDLSLESIIST